MHLLGKVVNKVKWCLVVMLWSLPPSTLLKDQCFLKYMYTFKGLNNQSLLKLQVLWILWSKPSSLFNNRCFLNVSAFEGPKTTTVLNIQRKCFWRLLPPALLNSQWSLKGEYKPVHDVFWSTLPSTLYLTINAPYKKNVFKARPSTLLNNPWSF